MTDSVAKRAKELRTGTAPYDLSYTFDAAGNRLTKTKDAVQTSYGYNTANRLLAAITGQSTTSYHLGCSRQPDPEGRGRQRHDLRLFADR